MLKKTGEKIPRPWVLSSEDKSALVKAYGLPHTIKFFNQGAYNASIFVSENNENFESWWGHLNQTKTIIVLANKLKIHILFKAYTAGGWTDMKSFDVQLSELPLCFKSWGTYFSPQVAAVNCDTFL